MRRSSHVLIAGLVLLVLGIGNLRMGSDKMRQYGNRIAYARELGGPTVDLPFRGTESILEPRARLMKGYQALMPTFQGQVDEEELVLLIEHIKSLGSTE